MDKYEYIVNLAEKTAKRVSQNRESWMKFLTSAARIYKYPFKEQLLIYAQNPDATACASIEIWNKRMNCWVNKGSSGIALPDDTATYGHKLKYVFDVSNVHAVKPNGRYPKAWKLREEHKSDGSYANHIRENKTNAKEKSGWTMLIRKWGGFQWK